MKYSIGYQLPDDYDSIPDLATDFKEHIDEVYFAWPGEASGRSQIGLNEELGSNELKRIVESDLRIIKSNGIKLVLLFNSNCYGADSISESFKNRIYSLVSYLVDHVGLDAITTTSVFVSKIMKEYFPEIEVRASINMRIGSIKGMQYISNSFDGYYMQREYNRDFNTIDRLHHWCQENGKSLYFLANSGCLNYCSSQTFHDNLVAHEEEIIKKSNIQQKYPSPCWDYMEDPKNWVTFLQNSWVRPEDIQHYEKYFKTAKLATRMHANPRKVISAYVRGRFDGNLLDLTEPGFSKLFANKIIDNRRIPNSWFETTSKCDKHCDQCNYCSKVLSESLVDIKDLEKLYVQ